MIASLSPGTRVCALVGAPVTHSLSPAMHNAAFAQLGLPFVYLALPVETAALPAAIAGAGALGFAGLNVTAPHKEAALALCEPDELARAVGAVNTITYDGGRALGTNTDVYGLERAIDALCADHLPRSVLVIGAGGAARAAIFVLASLGVTPSIYSRRARSIEVAGRRWPVLPLAELSRTVLEESDLIVEATPAGLGDDPPYLDVGAIAPGARVLDLVVRAATPLSRAVRERGLRVQLGDVMLLHQGARAFTLFTGKPAPLESMRAALDQALARAWVAPAGASS